VRRASTRSPTRPTTAKALGGALPGGAGIAAPDLAEVLQPGDHGSTFAGGPLVATAALAVLELIDDPELLRRVRELGQRLRDDLAAIEGVREVRGRGLMVGVGIEQGIDVAELAARLLESGLVVNVPEAGTLRLLPPLTISEQEALAALEILRREIAAAG